MKLAVLQLTVSRVSRGTMLDVNTHKAFVEAQHDDSGAQLGYWAPINEAPHVGAVVEVTVEVSTP